MARTAWRTTIPGLLLLLASCSAYATDASAGDIVATKSPPAASAQAPSQPATCTSPEDFVTTKCPLTWNGITLYGTIDGALTWRSHAAPFNAPSPLRPHY